MLNKRLIREGKRPFSAHGRELLSMQNFVFAKWWNDQMTNGNRPMSWHKRSQTIKPPGRDNKVANTICILFFSSLLQIAISSGIGITYRLHRSTSVLRSIAVRPMQREKPPPASVVIDMAKRLTIAAPGKCILSSNVMCPRDAEVLITTITWWRRLDDHSDQ